MIRPSLLPMARAASANSRSRRLKNEARTKRATGGHESAPMITTITPKLERRLRRTRRDDGRQHEQQRQQRNREKDVGDAHDRVVEPAAVVAGDRAERRADEHLHDHGEEADRQRDARAEEQAREQIAADLVGSERVAAARACRLGSTAAAACPASARCRSRWDRTERAAWPARRPRTIRERTTMPATASLCRRRRVQNVTFEKCRSSSMTVLPGSGSDGAVISVPQSYFTRGSSHA